MHAPRNLVDPPEPAYGRAMPLKSRDRPWVMIFILLSLLAHLVFVLVILLISHFFPAPKFKTDAQLASTTITLEDAPGEPPKPPPPHRAFVPTNPDKEATPKPQPIESDNDHRLTTEATKARDDTSLMPDIEAKLKNANLTKAPNAPSQQPPHPAQTNANGHEQKELKSAQTPPKPTTQLQPNPATAQQPSTAPAPKPSTTPPTPAKPQVAQQFDPNGLPVLPALNAPAMAPPNQHQEASPASSVMQVQEDTHGAVGRHGDNSPAAMATEFGRYKAKVYRAVGGRWYPKVDKQFQVLPVGAVHIQFTIHSDGSVETKVLSGNDATLQILRAISENAIRESAPFDPFTDTLKKEIAAEEGGDGESYTDDFSFSIYGG